MLLGGWARSLARSPVPRTGRKRPKTIGKRPKSYENTKERLSFVDEVVQAAQVNGQKSPPLEFIEEEFHLTKSTEQLHEVGFAVSHYNKITNNQNMLQTGLKFFNNSGFYDGEKFILFEECIPMLTKINYKLLK